MGFSSQEYWSGFMFPSPGLHLTSKYLGIFKTYVSHWFFWQRIYFIWFQFFKMFKVSLRTWDVVCIFLVNQLPYHYVMPCLWEFSFTWWLSGKESTCNVGTQVWSLSWEDPLEKEMATHPSILVWENPWTEESGRLQSMGSQKDWTWFID